MKMKSGLLTLGLLGALAGCGETSYFEVSVAVANSADFNCLSMINTCQVNVIGAGGETFTLDSKACRMPLSYNIGLFQYATDKESGNVAFHVQIIDGNLNPLGQGDSEAKPIKPGGRQQATVTIPSCAR